ncbi:cation:proton antiporter [Nafulsella turpanensis]|uniref:cation:proton antiporter n=1 Tax=Nafulsella turpanensis TaxID=1265690 RepID=UPI000349F9D8|nr:sodium:proton antiporter [Nafulsella turpanensis]
MIELAAILVLGIFSQWLAWKIKVPAILPLIFLGLLIGPLSTLFTPTGEKLVDGDSIFQEELLFSFVAISVSVILFEGGLTLKLKEIKKQASVIRNILTIGVLVTLVGGTMAAYYLMDLSWRFSFLFGTLIVVSGPTVVTPILRHVKPNQTTNTILKWEGILIDPLGALIAVLAFGFIQTSKTEQEYSLIALRDFFLTVATGLFLGVVAALLLYYLLKKNRLPHYLKNVMTLALVILTFAISELIMKEAGLLAVTAMGIILANLKIEELKQILNFKEDISLIITSVLFLLLSSRIELQELSQLGLNSIILFFVVILVVRPLGVFLSTINSKINFREKLFISWIGPKGIVAAAVASLFSLELSMDEELLGASEAADARLILPLVFMFILGTVVVQGASAKMVARWLGVLRKESPGVLFIGANEAARFIAKYLYDQGVPVLMADTAHANLIEAEEMGLPSYGGNILKENLWEEVDLTEMGQLFAMTSNTEINVLACKKFENEFGEDKNFRLISRREVEVKDIDKPKNLLFHGTIDFINLIQLVRESPNIEETPVNSLTDYEEFMEYNRDKIIPLFVRTDENRFKTISGYPLSFSKGDKLVYIENDYFIIKQEKTEAA